MIRVKAAEQASLAYYNETFKPRLEELLTQEEMATAVEFVEEGPTGVVPQRSRVKTLAVSAQLVFPNMTLLHASVLIEGNN